MKKISASGTNLVRISPILIIVAGNLIGWIASGFYFDGKLFLEINGPMILTLGFFSIWTFRIWNVEADGQKVIVKRWKTILGFNVSEILKIEIVPNVMSRGSSEFFLKIILKEPIQGKREIIFLPRKNGIEDKYLLDPWQKLRIERAQASLKNRKARR
jgi:hypothetical protein